MTAPNGAMVAFDPTKFNASVANMTRSTSARADFLRMDKSGDWYYGTDDTPIEDSDRLYVHPMGSVHGWQCWADTDLDGVKADLLGSVVAPTYEPLPDHPEEVPKNGRAWTEMRGLSLMLDGKPLTYTTTSLGGLDAVAALGNALRDQYREDPTKMVPVVQLTNDNYKHKKYGKTYVPVFKVVKWVAEPPKAEAAEAPAKKPAAKKAAPAPAKKAAAKTTRARA